MKKPKPKAKPRFLKLIAVVEDNFVPITGQITTEPGTNSWESENVITFKLDEDFAPISSAEEVGNKCADFLIAVLETAKERANG